MSQKRTSYSLAQKSEIIKYALDHQIKDACVKYKVHKSMLSRWIKNMDTITSADPTRKRLLMRAERKVKTGFAVKDTPTPAETRKQSSQAHRLAHILNDDSDGDESMLSSSVSTSVTDLCVSIGSSSLSEFGSDSLSMDGLIDPIPVNTKPALPTVAEAALSLWLLTQASKTACNPGSLLWTK